MYRVFKGNPIIHSLLEFTSKVSKGIKIKRVIHFLEKRIIDGHRASLNPIKREKKGEKTKRLRFREKMDEEVNRMGTNLAVDDEPTVLGGVVRQNLGQGVDLSHLSLSLSLDRVGWGGVGEQYPLL